MLGVSKDLFVKYVKFIVKYVFVVLFVIDVEIGGFFDVFGIWIEK